MTERDDVAVRAADVLPGILAGMPVHLRLAASGGKLTGEALARRDRLDAEADAAAAAERAAAQSGFRQRAWEASCPQGYRTATVAGLMPHQDPAGTVSGWLTSPSPLLLLRGPSRNGKTWSAWAVASQARAAGAWVAGWRVTDLMRQLRPSDTDPGRAERARDAITGAALVVADDLGREKVTDWTAEQVWDLLETRLSAGLRTIVTTNLGPEEILRAYGDPVLSRLEAGTIVPITGRVMRPDLR